MLTVRGTAFQPFDQDGGSAEVELLPDLLEGNILNLLIKKSRNLKGQNCHQQKL